MGDFIQQYIIPNLWGALAGIVSTVWIWWTAKPKQKIENDGGIVDNAKKVLEMSEDIAERLQNQLIASDAVITQLKEKLKIELEEANTCKKALKAVKDELADWKRIAGEQKIELAALKEEILLLRKALEENENSSNTTDNGIHLN